MTVLYLKLIQGIWNLRWWDEGISIYLWNFKTLSLFTDYKYSTFFDVKSVEGEHGIDLSILYLLEIDILDNAEEFKEKIIENQVSLEEMMLDTVEISITSLMSQGNNLYNIFNERNELIRAFEKMSL